MSGIGIDLAANDDCCVTMFLFGGICVSVNPRVLEVDGAAVGSFSTTSDALKFAATLERLVDEAFKKGLEAGRSIYGR